MYSPVDVGENEEVQGGWLSPWHGYIIVALNLCHHILTTQEWDRWECVVGVHEE